MEKTHGASEMRAAIPGSSKIQRLEENVGSLSISLSMEGEKEIRQFGEREVGGRLQDATGYAFADTPALQ